MGYIRHKALVVTGWDASVEECREFIVKELGSPNPKSLIRCNEMIRLVTPISEGINGYKSFAVLPDGSKERWDPSDFWDECIERLIEKIESFRDEDGTSLHYGYMQFYDEDGNTSLLRSG